MSMDTEHKITQLGNAHAEVNGLDIVKEQYLGEHKQELEEFHVTDGKKRDQDQEAIEKVRQLEELVGIASSNPFGTIDKEVFASKLNDMTQVDMQGLCMKIGIPPRNSAVAMREALNKEFTVFCQRHGTSMPTQPQQAIDPNSAEYKALLNIINN